MSAARKRARCRFIWLSATVDPAFYARYLGSVEVLETRAFDPAKAAQVRVLPQQPLEFLNERFVKQVMRERRGVAVFVPTRAEVEQIARELGARWPALPTALRMSTKVMMRVSSRRKCVCMSMMNWSFSALARSWAIAGVAASALVTSNNGP